MVMRNLLKIGRRKLHTLIISKETIKPSSPTPPHLKTYNLSVLDQLNPPIYNPFVFFYPNYGSTSNQDKAIHLKKSLSQTLTQYYPFSGRQTDGASVNCNDEGVEFVEARVNAPLSEVIHLHNSGYQPVDKFFPTDGVWGCDYKGSRSIVMVQLNYFSCGGLALAVSMSHKIADGCTLFAFLNYWAKVCQRNTGNVHVQALPPQFITSPKSSSGAIPEFALDEGDKIVTKKFVFSNSKLTKLKAMVKDDKVAGEDEISMVITNPTRVEVVCSLLLGCAVRASKANSGNSHKTIVITQAMNLRNKMVPPLPETTVGNVSLVLPIPITSSMLNENELGLTSVTARIKKAKMRFTGLSESQARGLISEAAEGPKNLTDNSDVIVYWSTSICRFPLYQVDFGWGKPIRVSTGGIPLKNVFLLMDTPSENGIEALVVLDEKDMATFQNDEQLLAFAT